MNDYIKKICKVLFDQPKTYVVNENTKNFDAFERTKSSDKDPIKVGCFIPRRYSVILLGFLSFAVLNAQRVNIVIALVAMTNSTEDAMKGNEECPSINDDNLTNIPTKIGTFDWNSEIQGYIIGSSFLGFVLTQAPSGRLSETMGAKQIMIFSLFWASLCNILSPLAANWDIYFFIAVQFLKGMAQGLMQPAVSCLMVRWYAKPEKAFLSSLTFSGYPVGALFGGIFSGALCDTDFLGGWPSVFYVFGGLGLALALLIHIYMDNSPADDKSITTPELKYIVCNQDIFNYKKESKIPWMKMIFSIPTWGLLAGMFGQYWMTFYFISVHPTYLATVLNFNITQSGVLSSLPYILQIGITWLSSYVSDWFIERKYASTDTARKTCNTLSCVGFSASLMGIVYSGCNLPINMVCFFTAVCSVGLGYPGSLTVPMDMTIDFAGTFMGLTSTIASTCGFIIPVIVGEITNEQQTIGQWQKVLVLSATVVLASGIIFHIFGSAKLQNWETFTKEYKKSSLPEIFPVCTTVKLGNIHRRTSVVEAHIPTK